MTKQLIYLKLVSGEDLIGYVEVKQIDFIKLLFVKNLNYDNQLNHNILEQEINLNERI